MCMKGRGNKEIQKMLKKGYSYFSYKNMNENVVAYGYEYPIKYHIETMVLMIIITFITGLFYQLDTAYIAIIIFTGLVCVPKLI